MGAMSPEIRVVAGHTGPGPRAGTDVVLLPIADDGGTPVYPDSVGQWIDELTSDGVSSDTWHPVGAFERLDHRSPIVDAFVQIGVGIATSGGWYALQALIRRRRDDVRVVAVYEQGGQRCQAEVTGKPDDVAAALAQLNPFGGQETPGSAA
jgi:hypothetical protein